MTTTTRWRRLAAALVAGVLTCLLAGCGGGDTTSSEIAATSPEASEGSEFDSEVWSNGVVELRVGDCVNDVPTAEGDPYDAEIVSCESPHDREVFLLTRQDFQEWEILAPALAAYVGVSTDEVEDWLDENRPNISANWNQDAGFIVFFEAEDGQLDSSYRNTGSGSTMTSTLEP